LASLWKFPGGILKSGESLKEGLTRTVFEEMGIRIQVGDQIAAFRHAYTHFRITLFAFRCTRQSGRPPVRSGLEWRWATGDDLKSLAFSRADRAIMDTI
jgi:A/G-specific adenine glycosylase